MRALTLFFFASQRWALGMFDRSSVLQAFTIRYHNRRSSKPASKGL
ncbi:MAG TPA: hypothetical protein VNN62_08410 [Methylomirabilota bacterium]|nr:hypothetical protein [Methylomirabilota bacterium]